MVGISAQGRWSLRRGLRVLAKVCLSVWVIPNYTLSQAIKLMRHRAADATAHLLYAYLRKYYDPERGGSNAAKLVRMYVEPHYPPKMSSLLQKRACKVVLEVRELASTPWELLERAGRTDGVPAVLRELIGFSSTKRLTPECLNVLDAIERHVQQWDSRDASDDHEQRPAFRQQTHLSAARVINVTQMALDEDFWRAWVQSNSPEETPERSLMFGQSIVVRTQQRDLVFGGTVTANDSSDVPEWVVFEEVKAVKKVKDMEAEEGNTFKKYNAIRRFNMPKFKSPRRPMRLGKSNDVNEAQQ
ncbi:hypothetical protein EDB81DRAFT_194685 [Dactylonectria macrodidyma]|uniref:Meiotically up-regulated protein Msb1/Mug8 domain-containing protein n=1 Tax=Dactylonectria macrodidyma TaxID=307937 RepID=A0A9P9FR50_9HYPO|nr:hypothetical protein EDB81DRAFT_194685 [Dactylonectria macrodidyma]